MFISLHYAYAFGDAMFAIVWVGLFLRRADVRREMLTVGSLMGGIAFLVAPYFADYWHPEYLFSLPYEEFFYGFFAGGIASVVYEEIYGMHFSRRRDRKHHWIILALTALSVSGILFFLARSMLLSVYASGALLLFCGTWMILFRKDLITDAVASGTIFAICTSIFFILYTQVFPALITAWWNSSVVTGVSVIGFPIQEIAWAFCLGFAVGPMYEFTAGYRFVKIR